MREVTNCSVHPVKFTDNQIQFLKTLLKEDRYEFRKKRCEDILKTIAKSEGLLSQE